MLSQPVVKEGKWRRLGSKCFTIDSATVMINNGTKARFTIETLEATDMLGISRGLLNHEGEVNRNALITLSSSSCRGLTMSSFPNLGLDTNRAGVKFSGNGNPGNPISIAMHVRHMTGMQMTKTLMPENMKLILG
jgi:hypothetical protein